MTVKRVRSLLKFLRTGRGLGKYKGGMEVVLRVSGGPTDAVFGTLPILHGGTEVSIDIPPVSYQQRIHVHGARPNHGDMLFQLDTTFMITEDGEWIVEPPFQSNEPIRRVRNLTIAVVEDWTDLLRRMQEELEQEDRDNRSLIEAIEGLDLKPFDSSFWFDLFTVPVRSWFSIDMLELVNCDHINPRLKFLRDRITADLDMRKPGGGRFGRAKFDFVMLPERIGTPVTFDYALEESTWQRIGVWNHAPLDIDFSRPGLNAVTAANQEALTEMFAERFGVGAEDILRIDTAANEAAIRNFWATLREVIPLGRRPSLPEFLNLFRGPFASRVRQKIDHPAARNKWTNTACYRPRLTSSIETIVTDPPMPIRNSRRTS